MATRPSARAAAWQLLIAVLIPLIVYSSFSSAANSNENKKTSDASAVTPAAGSSLPSQATTEGAAGGVSQTAGHATFGDITSQKGGCIIGNPNTFISTADVDYQWDRMSKTVPPFKNLIFDQIVNNNASLSYCVRWDSPKKLSKSVASKFEAMLARQFKIWNHWLIGYDCWPYEKIDIKVVGFAVRDASLLDWSDDSLGKIYEGVLDDNGVPKCPDECYKHLDTQPNADTSACKGKPFDMSLWPSTDVPGQNVDGAGGDWGQRVELDAMLKIMDDEQMMTLAHEIGHGFGLMDFYEPGDKTATFPAALMDQSETLTDADGWMLRRVLEHIKSRYNF
ncbi:hypothetical protein ON010_g12243 [Phytophthora cinnamomi]|nr:hypothetical protein ON010_g12243 [Phytophthora cinnamomi]